MHVKKDGSRAVLYRMPDPDDMHLEDLFHALRFAFLILTQQKELYVLHSASFLYRGAPFSFPAVPEPGSPHTLPCGMICTRRPS